MKKNRLIFNVVIHIAFWVGMCIVFRYYSYLRPGTVSAPYKESLSVLFIAIMVYFNYLHIIPKFFQIGKHTLYWAIALLSVCFAGLSEYFLVKPDIYKCFSNDMPIEEVDSFARTSLVLITIRDFGFFLFFFLLKLHNDLAAKYIQTSQAIAETTQAIFIPSENGKIKEVKISDIAYVSPQRNNSYFYLTNGTSEHQRSPLIEIEQQFPENTCLRINKGALVILSNVMSYDKEHVQVNLKDENGAFVTLKISEKHRNDILSVLNENKMLQTEAVLGAEEKNDTRGIKTWNNEKNDVFEDENRTTEGSMQGIIYQAKTKPEVKGAIKLHTTSILILKFIKKYNEKKQEGCRVPQIAEGVRLAKSTVEDHIKILKEYHLIEYRGAKRNGGYYASGKE